MRICAYDRKQFNIDRKLRKTADFHIKADGFLFGNGCFSHRIAIATDELSKKPDILNLPPRGKVDCRSDSTGKTNEGNKTL